MIRFNNKNDRLEGRCRSVECIAYDEKCTKKQKKITKTSALFDIYLVSVGSILRKRRP